MSLFSTSSKDYAEKLKADVQLFAIKMVVKDLAQKKQAHSKGYLCRKALDKAMSGLCSSLWRHC